MSQRKWKIDREGHRWSDDELERWLSTTPFKPDWMSPNTIMDNRLYGLLGLVLENLGIDRVIKSGNLEDWKAAIANREQQLSDIPGVAVVRE